MVLDWRERRRGGHETQSCVDFRIPDKCILALMKAMEQTHKCSNTMPAKMQTENCQLQFYTYTTVLQLNKGNSGGRPSQHHVPSARNLM